jgi:CDP-diacylglycerol--glycerol-3-phosphate 3-phosphatidyltransferase
MNTRHLPNTVTVLRLAAIPFIYWLSLSQTALRLRAGCVLFTILAASDWLDGYLARRLNARTRFGTLLDPVVDKVLILTVLFAFSARGLWPLWLVLINMFREFAVSAVRHGLTTESDVVGANWMGKTKFCLQIAVCLLGYLAVIAEEAGMTVPGGTALTTGALAAVTAVSLAFLCRFIWWHRHRLFSGESVG